jgi:hypothetical protein
MKETKVISGFPGIGKSVLTKQSNLTVLDSDSSQFSWIEKGVRNPDFPNNYMNHIKENIGKADYILVSSHDNVRQALKDNQIDYTIVYPSVDLKDEYMDRYAGRGNDEKFINFIGTNWDKFLSDIQEDSYPKHVCLSKGQFLSHMLHFV